MLRVIREDKKNVEDDNVWLQLRSQHRLALVIHGRDLECGAHDKYSVMMFLESAIAATRGSQAEYETTPWPSERGG